MKDTIYNFIVYNHWANKRLVNWLQSLDATILYKETAASFTSIDLTLQHMKNAQNFWYAVITETGADNLDETIKVKSFDAVADELITGSQKMIDRFTIFSEQELMTKVSSPVMSKGRYDFIFHAINHNSYHRGQIVTMARLLGVVSGIPETDYEAFLWSQK